MTIIGRKNSRNAKRPDKIGTLFFIRYILVSPYFSIVRPFVYSKEQ